MDNATIMIDISRNFVRVIILHLLPLLSPGRRWRLGAKFDLLGAGWWFEDEIVRSQLGLQVPVGELDLKARQILSLRVSHCQISRQRARAGLNPHFPMDPATLEGQVLARRTIHRGGAD